MSARHTPGPWAFSRCDQFGDARFYVCQTEGAPYTPDYSDVATLVAETCSGERVTIQEANARLIAAAPEMFDVIGAIVRAADGRTISGNLILDENSPLMSAARDVLAKATGSAQ